jgi:hypothetical protein
VYSAAPLVRSKRATKIRNYVVISLQTLLEHRLIVGGRTALELQGFAHYLATTGPREIHLYGEQKPPGLVRQASSRNPLRLS